MRVPQNNRRAPQSVTHPQALLGQVVVANKDEHTLLPPGLVHVATRLQSEHIPVRPPPTPLLTATYFQAPAPPYCIGVQYQDFPVEPMVPVYNQIDLSNPAANPPRLVGGRLHIPSAPLGLSPSMSRSSTKPPIFRVGWYLLRRTHECRPCLWERVD